MRLILCRHGNTFGPGDRVVWVGREDDLDLVPAGEAQARAVAAALAARGLRPDRVVAGALRRTRRFAEIIVEALALDLAPEIDPRLNEIAYGDWAGRTTEEIVAADPAAAAMIRDWNEADVWPAGAGWATREADVRRAVAEFLADLADAGARRALVVSSNGILRFVPRVWGLEPPDGGRSFRMRTGHVSILDVEGARARILAWNAAPEDLPPGGAG